MSTPAQYCLGGCPEDAQEGAREGAPRKPLLLGPLVHVVKAIDLDGFSKVRRPPQAGREFVRKPLCQYDGPPSPRDLTARISGYY